MSKNIIAYISILFFIIALIVGFLFYKSQKQVVEIASVVATPVSQITPEKFKSDVLGFEITLLNNLKVEEKTEGKVLVIGDKILVYELDSNPELCKGVCSVFTKKEDITVNNIKMRYLEGYWEELGEDNAQSFVSFVISKENKYLVFMLQELPIDKLFFKGRKVGQINNEELKAFKKIVESVILF